MSNYNHKVYFLVQEITEEIKNLMYKQKCTEVDLEDCEDPTDVIWYDNDGYPNESRVKKVCLDSENKLYIIVAGENSDISLYEGSDFALEVPNWLAGIYNSIEEHLKNNQKQ